MTILSESEFPAPKIINRSFFGDFFARAPKNEDMSSKSCILIVEDEKELVDSLNQCLTEEGYMTQSCGSITDAVHRAANQKYDCILLDMKLSRGTGEQLINVIRDNKSHFNFRTPIVVTSGHLDPELVKRLSQRINGILVKPYRVDALLEKVRSIAPAKK